MRPLTPLHRHVCRPQCVEGHSRQTQPQPHARTVTFFSFLFYNYLILIFFCLSYPCWAPPAERRSSDLSNLSRGSTRAGRQQKRNKTRLFPVTRPHVYSQNTISRCQGKSRSGRPVAGFGAPLNLPRVYRPVVCDDDAFVLPRRPSPPTAPSLHLRRDHHGPMPSSHVYLSTYKRHIDLHPHGSPARSSNLPSTGYITLCTRAFYNRAPVSIWHRETSLRCERLLTQYDSHSHCMPPGIHVLAPPAARSATDLPPTYTVR